MHRYKGKAKYNNMYNSQKCTKKVVRTRLTSSNDPSCTTPCGTTATTVMVYTAEHKYFFY